MVLTKDYLAQKYSKYNKEEVYDNKNNFIKFLNEIEKEFYLFDFKNDNRYVCVGRQRFLIDEMEELYYTKEQCLKLRLDICPTKWCLDSLIEIMTENNFLSLQDYENLININSLYKNKSFDECRDMYDSYLKEKIISLFSKI